MATFVLAHGAWSAAWAWRRLRPLMAASGHDFFAPTYTGLGEREHLAHPGIDLETHIADVQAVIETEELSDVVLVGHSYGGLVATGVAARLGDKIARLIYVDAFVPRNGDSLFDLIPAELRERMQAGAAAEGDGWLVPPNPTPPDTSPEDQAWISRHRCKMPIGCLSQKLAIDSEPACPRHFIYARIKPGIDPFRQFADRAQADEGWTLDELEVSHSPNVTAPELLMETLNRIVG